MSTKPQSALSRVKSQISRLDRALFGGRIREMYVSRTNAKHRALARFSAACLNLRDTSVAIDCGANVGIFTEMMARSGARVIAIDPEPSVHEALDRLAEKYTNISVVKAAISSDQGPQFLYRKTEFLSDPLINSQSSSIMNDKINIDQNTHVQVETVSLSRLIAEFGYVDLIKMDIEGAEVDVIDDLMATGAMAQIGMMFVETHADRVPSIKDSTAILIAKVNASYPGRVNFHWE